MHTLWAKIGWVSIFLTNRFQIDPNYLNLRGAKCIFSKSTPHQQYTRQQPSTSNAYLSNPMHTLWAKIGWVSIFLKKQIPNWRKWPQFESCQLYIFKICSTSTIHQTTAFNLKFIFVHSHAHPLSKYWPSQHNFKKQIPNWRKWPQFESCQCIFSKSTPHQQYTRQQPSTSNAYLSTPMHTLWAKIGWVSIFLKNWFQIDANDLNLRGAKCIFSKSTPHQKYTRLQPSTSNTYLSTSMHTLWAKIGWVSIFLTNRFQIDPNYLNLRGAKCIFSKSTPHQQYTRQQPSTSNAYLSNPMHTLWAKIGWVSIFLKKQIRNWRKWPQFESCQLYIFKICSTSTIHQTTAFNLKFIFVHSHAHPLSKYWLSQHIFKKQIPNWRKWPQFESCQCIFSKSTPHQQYTRQHPSTSNAYLSTPMHTLWAKIGWVSIFLKNWFQIDANDLNLRVAKCIFSISTPHQQYTRQEPSTSNAYLSTSTHTLWAKIGLVSIFLKKQIPNWRKWPQFESCLMYIFKIYSSSTIHQTTAFNLKCIFVQSHAHPLSKNWLSQHIFKKTDSKLTQMTSIWELPNVYFQNLLLINNTPDNTLQPQMHICPLPCTPFEQKLAESAYF